jgi:ubiquinone biosynthesis protein UbiJ
MKFPSLNCARIVRDGGIDAMAALDQALHEASQNLSRREQQDLKRIFGQVMGEVVVKIINPAAHAFPELELDENTWAAIAKARAEARSNAAAA